LWRRASCKEQKRTHAPGMAKVMDRSSSITCCHFVVEVCLWVSGMLARIVYSRSTRCFGNWMVLVVVPSTQPRTTLRVAHVTSPFGSFLMEAGSWWNGPSVLPRPRNTLSRLCRSACFTSPLLNAPPCTIPISHRRKHPTCRQVDGRGSVANCGCQS
jgi:hypothetical protein